jgi:hypothetical protein
MKQSTVFNQFVSPFPFVTFTHKSHTTGKDSRNSPQRAVAIKKMGITPRNTKYLIAEISVQQNSKHPNIVEFIGSWLLDIELWVRSLYMFHDCLGVSCFFLVAFLFYF